MIPNLENVWGKVMKSGNASGMIGMFQRNEVDMGAVHFSVNRNRMKVVDFTHSFLVVRYVCIQFIPHLFHLKSTGKEIALSIFFFGQIEIGMLSVCSLNGLCNKLPFLIIICIFRLLNANLYLVCRQY